MQWITCLQDTLTRHFRFGEGRHLMVLSSLQLRKIESIF